MRVPLSNQELREKKGINGGKKIVYSSRQALSARIADQRSLEKKIKITIVIIRKE